MKYDNLLHATL